MQQRGFIINTDYLLWHKVAAFTSAALVLYKMFITATKKRLGRRR